MIRHLTNFHSLFEPHIITRGKGYFNSISQLKNSFGNHRTVFVKGTHRYKVEIELSQNDWGDVFVDTMDCNCEYWDNCKHQVAVLLKLQDKLKNGELKINNNAIEAAKQQNKNVLLIYGGEWCIWCHVLDRYFNGKIQTHDYVWRDSNGDLSEWIMNETVSQDDIDNAILLNHYMADNFVIAHIDGDYTNGSDALAYVGYYHQIYFYPTIMALDKQGQFATMMPPATTIDGLSFRELNGQVYRGYDRKILLQEMQKLHQAANF